jgi:hypothetical protein
MKIVIAEMIISKITGIVIHQSEKSTNSKDFKIAMLL